MTDAKPEPFTDPPADALIAEIDAEAEYWRVQAIYFRHRDEHQLAQDADTRRELIQRARDRIAEQAERINGYQGSRDHAIELLAKALGVEADKVRAVEYYARLASERIAALEAALREIAYGVGDERALARAAIAAKEQG